MNEINFKEFYDHLSRPHKENKGMQKMISYYSEKWFKRCAKLYMADILKTRI